MRDLGLLSNAFTLRKDEELKCRGDAQIIDEVRRRYAIWAPRCPSTTANNQNGELGHSRTDAAEVQSVEAKLSMNTVTN
jgi:hypothetical protein